MTRTKFSLVAAALGLVAFSVGAAQAAGLEIGKWDEFASSKGNYTVAAPVELSPEESKNDAQMTITAFNSDKAKFGVAYMDVPASVVAGDLEANFDEARDVDVKRANGKVIHERKIRLNNHPGREVELVALDTTCTLRMYFVGNRFYQVVAINTDGHSKADCLRFLDSFRIMNDPAVARPYWIDALR